MTSEKADDLVPSSSLKTETTKDIFSSNLQNIPNYHKTIDFNNENKPDKTEIDFVHTEKDCFPKNLINKINEFNEDSHIGKEMISRSNGENVKIHEGNGIEHLSNLKRNSLENLEKGNLESHTCSISNGKLFETTKELEKNKKYEREDEQIKPKMGEEDYYNNLIAKTKEMCKVQNGYHEKGIGQIHKDDQNQSLEDNGEIIYKYNFNEPFKEAATIEGSKNILNCNGNNFTEQKFSEKLYNDTNGSYSNKAEKNEPYINCNDIIDFHLNKISSIENIYEGESENHGSIDWEFINEKTGDISLSKSNSIIPANANENTIEDFLQEITQELINKSVEEIIVKENKKTESYFDSEEETEDDEDDIIPRVRRSSSLKTYKTPPGTPGRKKIVRFADMLGLDLADVRTFLDDIPKIPNYAYKDLGNANIETSVNTKTMLVLFQQQGGQANFLNKVRINNVMLENVIVENYPFTLIRGLIRVLNLSFHKLVHVRYSIDSWKSFSDIQATYVEGSFDGVSDKFSFVLHTDTLNIGDRVEFAVRYQCEQREYWDNNNGGNYCLQCMPVARPVNYAETSMDDQIASFFYKGNQMDLQNLTVQDFITSSLETTEKQKLTQASKPEIFSIILFIIFSIVLMYMKKIFVS